MPDQNSVIGSAAPFHAAVYRRPRGALTAALLSALGSFYLGGVAAAEPPAWPDTAAARLEALALIQTLNAQILASTSATLTLEQWCREHDLADPPQIVAHPGAKANVTPTAIQRQELQVSAQEVVRYRRVELSCGERVLSIADNWYVPSRLTPQMNHLLDSTLTPFGKVVQPLMPHRETIAVRLLWAPLPADWERSEAPAMPPNTPQRSLAVPAALFEHRAILYTPDQRPIAEVDEVYQRAILAFPEPRLLNDPARRR